MRVVESGSMRRATAACPACGAVLEFTAGDLVPIPASSGLPADYREGIGRVAIVCPECGAWSLVDTRLVLDYPPSDPGRRWLRFHPGTADWVPAEGGRR